MKVLIVEDEILAATVLARILTRLGYEVCEPVMSGEEALQVVREQQPDVVIMDIRLSYQPEGGIEAARQMRAFSQVPIIFTSGYADEKTEAEALAWQPAAYLLKPLDIPQLRATITKLTRVGGETCE